MNSWNNYCINLFSINKSQYIIIYKIQRIILLIKALPKDIAALDKRSVLANVNSQGSGT